MFSDSGVETAKKPWSPGGFNQRSWSFTGLDESRQALAHQAYENHRGSLRIRLSFERAFGEIVGLNGSSKLGKVDLFVLLHDVLGYFCYINITKEPIADCNLDDFVIQPLSF